MPAQPALPLGINVAMVLRNFSPSGGLELYAHKLVEGLLSASVRVTVICAKDDSGLKHPLLTVVRYDEPKAALPKWRRMVESFQAASRAVRAAGPFDIVHSQHCPVEGADVVTFHNQTASRLSLVGYPWERLLNDFKLQAVPAYRLRFAYDRLLFENARCLVFPSQIMQSDFYAAYGTGSRLASTPYVVAHPGAELPGEAGAAPDAEGSARQGGDFPFLFVGRGFRKKGLDVLLAACQRLSRKGRRFSLRIAGLKEKPLDRLLLRLNGLAGKVVYLGFQKDMEAVFASADAFVMPSKLEPFGMAALQAMKRGLPAIVSRASGVSELITDGDSGLILEDHLSAAGLADLMERLMDDEALARRLAKGGKLVADEATWERTSEATLRAYEQARQMSNAALGPQNVDKA